MSDLISQIVDHVVRETLIGGRQTGDMVVDGQTATEIAQFKTLLAAKLREATPEGSPGGDSPVESIILIAPDDTHWRVTVNNDGVLITTQI